uniref:Transmembrane protein 192 n=1 Tax=Tetraodon nigroviridis TaxID=99883 RepID=H3DMT8_TETNG
HAVLFQPTVSSVDLSRSIDDDSLVDGPLISPDALHSVIRREFQPVPTPCHASLLSFIHVAFVVLSLCVGVLCELKFGQEEVCTSILGAVKGDSAILYGKVFLWVLVVLFTAYAQRHHGRARSRGYLRFYRQMQGLRYLPINVHSTGNVLLLLVTAAPLSPIVHTYMLLIILGLELLVALPSLIYYTIKVIQFNRERAPPDVSQEEHPHIPSETGFREGSNLEEVVEKQADLIEYLKQHNTLLSRRLLNLTA